MSTRTKTRKPVSGRQFGLRANNTIATMIDEVMVAEGHNSWAGAIIQAVRDKHQRLVENGRILQSSVK